MPALVRCHPLTHMQPEEPERSPLEASGDSAPTPAAPLGSDSPGERLRESARP